MSHGGAHLRSRHPEQVRRFARCRPFVASRAASGSRQYGVSCLRVLLVVNSFASSVTARNTVIVHRRLARHCDVEVVETNRRGHATRFALDAARRGIDVVVGFGGDGTLNEVATGIARTATALGVLPGGSTNVFARTIGLPNDPVEAVELLADALERGDTRRPIGLGQVNGRYFCFHTGVGYDAAVVERVERRGALKRWLGTPAVHHRRGVDVAARLRPAYATLQRRAPRRRRGDTGRVLLDRAQHEPVHLPGQPPARPVPARDTRPGTGGGHVQDDARHGDPRFAGGALRGGGIEPAPHLDVWTDVEHFVIEHDTPFPYQVDGDALGDTQRLEFRHVPNALDLVTVAPTNGVPDRGAAEGVGGHTGSD